MSSNFFWSMFYGGDNSQNEVDTYIKEDQLEKILNLNTLMQELNASNKLIDYLSKYETVAKLIQYAYNPSIDPADRRFAQVANDIFVYDIPSLLDNIADSDALLDLVFSALRPYSEEEKKYISTAEVLDSYQKRQIDINNRPPPFDTLLNYDLNGEYDFDSANTEPIEDDNYQYHTFIGPILKALSSSSGPAAVTDVSVENIIDGKFSECMTQNENENENCDNNNNSNNNNNEQNIKVTLLSSSATDPLPLKSMIIPSKNYNSECVYNETITKGNIFKSDVEILCDDPMKRDTSPGAELCIPPPMPVNYAIANKFEHPINDNSYYYYSGIKVKPTCIQRRVPLNVTENFCRLIIMLIRNPNRITKLQNFLLKHPEIALLFCETIQAAPITEAFHYLVVGKPEYGSEFYQFQTSFLNQSNTIENMLSLYINNANFDSLMHVSFILCSLLSNGLSQFSIRQKLLQDLPIVINHCMNEKIHPGSARTLLQITVSVFRETIKDSIMETEEKKSLFYARAIENLLIPCTRGLDKMLTIDFKADGVYGLLKLHAISGLAELLRLSDLAKDACQEKRMNLQNSGFNNISHYGNNDYEPIAEAIKNMQNFYTKNGATKYQFNTLHKDGIQSDTANISHCAFEDEITTNIEDDENYDVASVNICSVSNDVNNNMPVSTSLPNKSIVNANLSNISINMLDNTSNPRFNQLVKTLNEKPEVKDKNTRLLPFVIGLNTNEIHKQMNKISGGLLYCGDEEAKIKGDPKDRGDAIKIRDTLGINGEIIYGTAAYIAKYLVDRDLPFKAMCQMLLYPNHSIVHHAVSVITTQLLEYTSYCPELSLSVFNPRFFELLRIAVEQQNSLLKDPSYHILPDDSREVKISKVRSRLQKQTLHTSLDAYVAFLIEALNKAACGLKGIQKNTQIIESWATLEDILKNDENLILLVDMMMPNK